jgi:DNA-binding Lrp family transcriptional regulator
MDSIAVSNILTDEYSARILIWSMEKPRTAAEMSRNLGIPISACYNRIRVLEKLSLLKCVEMRISTSGKHTAAYRSDLKRASIQMERGEIKVRFELVDGKVEDYTSVQEIEKL